MCGWTPGIRQDHLGDMTEHAQPPDLLADPAARLNASLSDTRSLVPADTSSRARILRIARDIAHATERQNAPLAAYLIGRFVQESIRAGVSETQALDRAGSTVRSLIGEAPG